MSTIKIENLTFAYPGGADNVFEGLNLQLDSNWRLGLVGRNGRGKTTLLRLLMGEYEYSGKISAGVRFEYFPKPAEDASRTLAEVLRASCPDAEDWELERELGLLGVDDGALERPFGTLSNGEQTKAMLAALFIDRGSFPLIDEPTNHLDAEGRRRVAAYLSRKRGFILVSHDRSFLDGCVDHILSLNRSGAELRAGSFSAWYADFEARQAAESAANDRLKKDIARLKQSAARASEWSDRVEASKKGALDKGYVGHKAAKMMKRSKSIEARQNRAAEEKSALLKDAESAGELKLSPLIYRSETLARFERVSIAYGGRRVCAPVSFEIGRGERIALSGGNGSGKSSLIKLLLGAGVPHEGEVRVGSGLEISYVPQDASGLAGSLADFAREGGVDEALFKAVLRKLGFERAQLALDMSELSAGQKKKALIARSLCTRAHLYVWDEPLNYIDLWSRVQLERLILRFEPSLLFVEHDAAFRRSVATRTVELQAGDDKA